MPGRGDNEVPIGTRATVDGVPWILSADGWGPVSDPRPLPPPDPSLTARTAMKSIRGFFGGRWVRHNPYLGRWVPQPLEPPAVAQRLRDAGYDVNRQRIHDTSDEPIAYRIVPRREVATPDGFTAELVRRAMGAGYPTLMAYVDALEDEVVRSWLPK